MRCNGSVKRGEESELERNLQVSNVKRLLRDIARGEGDGGREERDAYQVRKFEFLGRIAAFIPSFFEGNFKVSVWICIFSRMNNFGDRNESSFPPLPCSLVYVFQSPHPIAQDRTANVVLFCLLSRNAFNFTFKALAWLYTGSHSMFAGKQ